MEAALESSGSLSQLDRWVRRHPRLKRDKRRHLSGFGSCHHCMALAAMAMGLPPNPQPPDPPRASSLLSGVTFFLMARQLVLPIHKTLSKQRSTTKAMKADWSWNPRPVCVSCVTLGRFVAVHIEPFAAVSFGCQRKGAFM